MTGPLPSRAKRQHYISTNALLGAIVAALLLVQGWLATRLSVNWDEFRFLADVHELARGELTASVQTFHGHFFQWLLAVSNNEIDQIIAGRFAMLALECITAYCIYRCSREFAVRSTSLLAVICYLTFGFVFYHGASFRFDPLATFFLMAALTVALVGRLHIISTAIVGALIAFAALVTIKSIFYLPALGGVFLWRLALSENRKVACAHLIGGAVAGAALLGVLYWWHQSLVVDGSIDAAGAMVSGSIDKTIRQTSWFPRANYFLGSFSQNPLNWLLTLGGIGVAIQKLWAASGTARVQMFALLSFATPLFTLLFYRNAFPYYYSFMLAPVCVTATCAIGLIEKRLAGVVIALLLCLMMPFRIAAVDMEILSRQRAIITATHSIFREGSVYIDRSSMISSWRKRGLFMSTWMTEVYRAKGQPIFPAIISRDKPKFLILNSPMIEKAVANIGSDERLLPADAAALRENFIPHWGPIWIAGKSIDLTNGSAQFRILAAGRYTLEASGPVTIDGIVHAPRTVVSLDQGEHWARGKDVINLRGGEHTPVPHSPPPTGPLFADF